MLFLAILLGFVGCEASAQKCAKVKPHADRVGTYTAGELAGRTLGDLYAAYIGARLIPPKVTVDPGRQLDSLWLVKLSCHKNAAPVVSKLHRELLTSYRKKRSALTLGEFIELADRQVKSVQGDLDWRKFSSIYRLTPAEEVLVARLAARLSGRDFVAYGMTEVMPSANGVLNLQVLEFLVRNFGPEFVFGIPAIHDRYASFGLFQFTSFAVNGETKEGASMASQALKRGYLPSSVAEVRGEMQFRAAYLFAMHNIAKMVKHLTPHERTVLSGLGGKNHDDLIQFIAASHNGPAFAQRAARRWLDNRMRSEFYVSVSRSSVRQYAYKTKMNLEALLEHRDLSGILYGDR